MHRVHKVALDLNNVQATYMAKAAGTARFAYNWALAQWKEQYERSRTDPEAIKPSQLSLRRRLNAVKAEQFGWMLEVTKCAPQEAIIDLGRAFANFFAGRAGFPSFHRKGERDSFRLSPGQFAVQGRRLRIPNLGWVKMREDLRWPDARLLSVTISKRRDRWFASVVCDLPDPVREPRPVAAVGIDVGTGAYVTSDAKITAVPRAYRKAEAQLRRAQQALSRKQRGSKNRARARARVARIHGRTADVRANWLHQLTRDLVDEYSVIGIEDLNVRGMTKNKRLAKSVLDAGFFEFRRQLEYKAPESGAQVVVADRWFPSSKTCNACGARTKHLPLQVRSWVCECGTSHHRDINAAINLRNNAASSAVSACGEFSAPDPPGLVPGRPSSLDEAGTGHQLVGDHV